MVKPSIAILVALSTSVLLGCGAGQDRGTSQVAAKVNEDEISVHQINFVLQRQGVPAEQVASLRQEILDRLIDRQLAVQRAEELSLHKQPSVVMAMESARQDALAQAYAERLAGSVPTPTSDEVKRYYADHPQLFRERRVYQLQELLISVAGAQVDQVLVAMKQSDGAAAKVEWLREHEIKFSAQQATRAAEQLPMADLVELATLKAGEALVRRSPTGVQVVMVAGSRPEPVDEAAAARAIEQFLVNDRKRGILERDRVALRSAATIVYSDGYQAPESGPAKASAGAADPVSSDAAPGLSPESLKNGLKGLK